MSYKFKAFPKIPRLEKLAWSITEKIDGTNGIVYIVPITTPRLADGGEAMTAAIAAGALVVRDMCGPDNGWAIFAGSRSRWLSPYVQGGDNYGFAAWVLEHAEELVRVLGPGWHVGEWWGQGIQRGYDQKEKQFSLFSPWRYPRITEGAYPDAGGCIIRKVPLLAMGHTLRTLADEIETWALDALPTNGSIAAPGYMNPEGLVVTIDKQSYKVIINHGDKSKSRDGA